MCKKEEELAELFNYGLFSQVVYEVTLCLNRGGQVSVEIKKLYLASLYYSGEYTSALLYSSKWLDDVEEDFLVIILVNSIRFEKMTLSVLVHANLRVSLLQKVRVELAEAEEKERDAAHKVADIKNLIDKGTKEALDHCFVEMEKTPIIMAPFYYGLGMAAININNHSLAFRSFLSSVHRGAGRREVYEGLLTVSKADGNSDLALQYAKELKPYLTSNRYAVELGKAYNFCGEHGKAVEIFQQQLDNPNVSEEVVRILATTYLKLRAYKEIVRLLEDQKPDLYKLNYSLAFALAYAYDRLNETSKAIEMYEMSIRLNTSHFESLFNLGNLYKRLKNNVKALSLYRIAAELRPSYEPLSHLINSLAGITTERPPDAYVEELFDNYAETFEKSLTNDLKYDAPIRIAEKLNKLMEERSRILDIGCGTGLLGSALKGEYSDLVGIDISKKMLMQCEQKKTYTKLIKGAVPDILNIELGRFDFIVAADVLIYIGDAGNLFERVKTLLVNNGYFIITTEWQESGDYTLADTGRYIHSTEYVNKLARKTGFQIEDTSKVTLRTESSNKIKGEIHYLRPVS